MKLITMKLLLIVVLFCIVESTEIDISKKIIDILESKAYNSLVMPASKDEPLVIYANITFDSVEKLSRSFSANIFVLQTWYDSRLFLNHSRVMIPVSIGAKVTNKVWKPDLYFVRAQSISIQSTDFQFLKFHANGQILFNQKVSITVPCDLDPVFFPFDQIQCSLQLMSYGYAANELEYSWKNKEGYNPYVPEKDLAYLGYRLSFSKSTSQIVTYDFENYSIIFLDLYFERCIGIYFVQVYVPATFIVALSWLGFWLNRNATPARASIGITTVLTMLTLVSHSSKNYDAAVNNAVKAIDVYIWFCFVSVVSSMVMFACGDFFNTSTFVAHKQKTVTSENPSPVQLNKKNKFKHGQWQNFK